MTDDQIIEWAREVDPSLGNIDANDADFGKVRAFVRLVRNATLDDAAAKADATVCDTHLPTGVRVYGSAAGDAIRAMKEN